MKVLITGGAGFIGSYLSEEHIKRGDEVYIIDNLSTGSLKNIEKIRFDKNLHLVTDSVLNEGVMNELVGKCDVIYHMAAAVGVKLIMENPVETIETNVRGTEVVLKMANLFKKKIIVASTSEVYGKAMDIKEGGGSLSEGDDLLLGPTSKRRWAYACSKAVDEFLALAYYDEKGLPVTIVRLFNTVGPRQTGRYGMVIPTFVKSALLGKALSVFGDGNQSRCFSHVKDVVGALMGLMDCDDAVGEIVNIGSSDEISINDLAQKIIDYTKSKSAIEHIPYEKVYGKGFEDMQQRRPDLAKIKGLIGYVPENKIDDIVKDVVEFYEK
jgi:nucleoside-diphosphate-sugar epimerase